MMTTLLPVFTKPSPLALCALVVFAISFLSRMEESAEHRSVAVVTRVDCLQGLWRIDYG
ncbi:hypothetical protein BOT92_001964 [Escherichia coli]|nr:hypothetical protein [Escherichia coli]ELK6044915.1 hypothetical protein [Escherichia coli]HCT8776722.1 hypothetical protein [Escherichia coli]